MLGPGLVCDVPERSELPAMVDVSSAHVDVLVQPTYAVFTFGIFALEAGARLLLFVHACCRHRLLITGQIQVLLPLRNIFDFLCPTRARSQLCLHVVIAYPRLVIH